MDSNVMEVKRLAEEKRLALGSKDFERADKLHTEMLKALEKVESKPETDFDRSFKSLFEKL